MINAGSLKCQSLYPGKATCQISSWPGLCSNARFSSFPTAQLGESLQNALDEESLARLATKAASGSGPKQEEEGPEFIEGGVDVCSAIAANVWEVLAQVRRPGLHLRRFCWHAVRMSIPTLLCSLCCCCIWYG